MQRFSIQSVVAGMAAIGAAIVLTLCCLAAAPSNAERPARAAQPAAEQATADAVAEAQTPKAVPIARPEQRKTEHDQS